MVCCAVYYVLFTNTIMHLPVDVQIYWFHSLFVHKQISSTYLGSYLHQGMLSKLDLILAVNIMWKIELCSHSQMMIIGTYVCTFTHTYSILHTCIMHVNNSLSCDSAQRSLNHHGGVVCTVY